MNYLTKPALINLEVTRRCSLGCPQCYCQKDNQIIDLDFTIAKAVVEEAAILGVEYMNISGGETLMYPSLLELISVCSTHNIFPNIAISGVGFDKNILNQIVKQRISGIFISLNGSTESINAKSRNGFFYAINALDIISKSNFQQSAINWVMQSNNADDFPNVVRIAEQYGIKTVFILMRKPNDVGVLEEYPSMEQIKAVSAYVQEYSGKTQIVIDSCFSQMRAFMGNWIFGNSNVGMYRGCTAGIDSFTVNVDGTFSPCRHLQMREKVASLKEYWTQSLILKKLRSEFSMESLTCRACTLKDYCRPCAAVLNSQELTVEMENIYCPFCNG